MKFRKHIKEEFGLRQFDIAPLIDVVFILLVFFMLTSSFIVKPGIKVDLPKTVTHQAVKSKRLSIVVTAEDVVYLNGEVAIDEEIRNFLEENKDKVKSVFIKADKYSSMGRVVEVWDICREVGLSHINIATTHVEK